MDLPSEVLDSVFRLISVSSWPLDLMTMCARRWCSGCIENDMDKEATEPEDRENTRHKETGLNGLLLPPPPLKRLKRSIKCPLLPEIVPRLKVERNTQMTRAMYQRITVISKMDTRGRYYFRVGQKRARVASKIAALGRRRKRTEPDQRTQDERTQDTTQRD
jgi:hypothetical protein